MSPHAVAIRHEGRPVTYSQLHERVMGLARGLRAHGVRRDDRVAYLGPNHPAYLETLFATGLLGAIFVPVNTRLAAPEIDHVLADCGATVLVRPDTVDDIRQPGMNLTSPAEPVTLDDPCLIMYTSGTTGHPKGAVLTHGNLTWNCVNVLIETDVAADERTLVVAPLFHVAALGMTCLPTLLKGGTVVLMSSFDPAAVLGVIERERITTMFGVPTMFEAIAAQDRWLSADLSSVRTLLCGGAPLPADVVGRYLGRGLNLVQGYGMTETSPGVLMVDRPHAAEKASSAGVPSFFTDVRVVDHIGSAVSPGAHGEVIVSGPNVMRGYWGKPEETAVVLRNGWFHSGDVAAVDADGYFHIVDRLKNVIISGGENVYPAEVERVLHELEGVAACVVIGVPHPTWGEVGAAVVVAAPGARLDEAVIREALRDRLAGYKVPKHIRLVDTLPTTGSGKIAREAVLNAELEFRR